MGAQRSATGLTDFDDLVLEAVRKAWSDLFGRKGKRHGQQQRKFIIRQRRITAFPAALRDFHEALVHLFFDVERGKQRVAGAIHAKCLVQRFDQRLRNGDGLFCDTVF